VLGERETFINYDMQESVLKNALMIRFPDGKYAGKVIPEQVQGIDLLPTLLSYLNIPIAGDQQGVNLMPLVRGEAGATGSEYVFIDRIPWWEHWMSRYFLEYKFRDPLTPNVPPSEKEAIIEYEKMLRKEFPLDSYPPGDIAVRTNHWKLVIRKYPELLEKVSWYKYLTNQSVPVPAIELYDLLADPFELKNVATEHPEIVADLKPRLLAWDADMEKRKAVYHGTGDKRYIIPYP
jgi:arylsulfatase A-like enzyme